MIRRGETATVNGDDQSERSTESQDNSHDTVRGQTTPTTWRLATVIRQPLYETNVATQSAKLVMEARTVELIRRYREKCERRDNQKRYRDRIAHLERMIADIPEVDVISEENERQLEIEIDKIEQEHNRRDDTTRIFRVREDTHTCGELSTTLDSSINIHTVPTLMDLDRNAMLIMHLRMMGDIDINSISDM